MNSAQNDSQTPVLISSLEQAYQLKSIPRSGWIQSDIPAIGVESIAAHSFGMSILILYLRPQLVEADINIERCLNMAIIHDLAEVIVGDITPLDQVSASDKYLAEAAAFQRIVQDVNGGDHLKQVWDEFEAEHTPESQLVKRMDKLDMLIQAYLYEKQYSLRLDSFWEGMNQLFKETESEPIYNYIQANRFETKRKE